MYSRNSRWCCCETRSLRPCLLAQRCLPIVSPFRGKRRHPCGNRSRRLAGCRPCGWSRRTSGRAEGLWGPWCLRQRRLRTPTNGGRRPLSASLQSSSSSLLSVTFSSFSSYLPPLLFDFLFSLLSPFLLSHFLSSLLSSLLFYV